MIVTFPAGTGEFVVTVAASLVFGAFGWFAFSVFWLVGMGGAPTEPIPLSVWGLASVLLYLLFTGRIVLREVPA